MEQPQLLSNDALDQAVATLNVAWSSIPGHGLVRIFDTANFGEGLALVNKIGQVAQQHNHHPEITLRYDQVEVVLTTHRAGGITQLDITLAQAIDGVTNQKDAS